MFILSFSSFIFKKSTGVITVGRYGPFLTRHSAFHLFCEPCPSRLQWLHLQPSWQDHLELQALLSSLGTERSGGVHGHEGQLLASDHLVRKGKWSVLLPLMGKLPKENITPKSHPCLTYYLSLFCILPLPSAVSLEGPSLI